MHRSVESWCGRHNLVVSASYAGNQRALPREVVVYLLVTWAVRPEYLPADVRAMLAYNFMGHCVSHSEN